VLRAAVIGCGAIGAGDGVMHPELGVATHADAYVACLDTELVAVCDTDPERARFAQQRWGAQAYAEAEALLAEHEPEIVSIATPNGTHAELVAACLRADSVRAVLAEKPLALGVSETAALVDLARRRGVVLGVNYTRRFAPAYRRLRMELASGTLGELQHVSGTYVKGLAHNGTHWLDLLRMLAGEPESVRGWDRLGEGGDDPTLDAELTLPGGAGARLAALDTRHFTAFEMELVLTRGRVRISDGGHLIERWDVGEDARYPGHPALQPRPIQPAALRDGTLHAVEDLVRCVLDGRTPACGGADAVACIELVEAIRASAADDGRPVFAQGELPCAA
jgi:predicted dehydrogenase